MPARILASLALLFAFSGIAHSQINGARVASDTFDPWATNHWADIANRGIWVVRGSCMADSIGPAPALEGEEVVSPSGLGHVFSMDINPEGTTTGEYRDEKGWYHFFLRDARGQSQSFDVPGKPVVSGSINPARAVTGIYVTTSDFEGHGFVRSAKGNLTTFDVPGAIGTVPVDINPAGTITGSFYGPDRVSHSFLRAADGTIITFEVPIIGALGTVASVISASGTVAGKYYVKTIGSVTSHAFVRAPNGVFTMFQILGGAYLRVTGINDAGEVCGSFEDGNGGSHAFLRSSDSMISIFDAPGAGTTGNQGTYANGINASGTIVGSFRDRNLVSHGFLRAANGLMTVFDVPDATMTPYGGTSAGAINEAGAVTGVYYSSETLHGFVRSRSGQLATFDASDLSGPASTLELHGVRPDAGTESARMTFALAGLEPNPATENPRISFTLPSGGTATLEVFSVNGRRVLSSDVGSLGAGAHLLNVDRSGMRPGVYWIRLTQGDRTITKKGVLVE